MLSKHHARAAFVPDSFRYINLLQNSISCENDRGQRVPAMYGATYTFAATVIQRAVDGEPQLSHHGMTVIPKEMNCGISAHQACKSPKTCQNRAY